MAATETDTGWFKSNFKVAGKAAYNAITNVLEEATAPKDSDGSTEDNTAVCKALRSYYEEKRQIYPAWLPPDPKKAQPVAPPVVQYSQPRLGAGYGAVGGGGGGRSAGGQDLHNLFDRQAAQQQGRESPQSLRAGRPGIGGQQRSNASLPPAQQVVANPMPSARAGSYQNAYKPPTATAQSSSARLKNKLGRGRPGLGADPMEQNARQASYNSTSSGGSYDNRAAGDSYGRSGGQSAPKMSANSPWDMGDSGFTAEAYTPEPDYGQSGSRRPGLPSGPGAGRQGLPSGPRGRY